MSSTPAAKRDRWFGVLRWALLVVAITDLAALKTGLVSHAHVVLAWLMGAALLVFGARVIQLAIPPFGRALPPAHRLARLAVAAGVVVALAGGLANWLLGLQGYVILHEQEKARLRAGAELQAFEPGPWADIDELEVLLGLDELELVPAGESGFFPASHLSVWRGHRQPVRLVVEPRHSRASGPLRFHQGAFGFAPRIVILKNGEATETLFDKIVPFLTERHGPDGIRFTGSFTIADADLRVEGAIRLDSLDEGLRGHATLDLTVELAGSALGSGSLLPGHFAELDGGYRIGFAGLNRWSEIVISRRSYGKVMLGGAGLAAAGGFLLVFLHWASR
jgi:hypothetical protein